MIWTNQRLKRIIITMVMALGLMNLVWGYYEMSRQLPGLSTILFAWFAGATLMFCLTTFYLCPIFESYNTGRKRPPNHVPRSYCNQLCLFAMLPSCVSGMMVAVVGLPRILAVFIQQYPPSILYTPEFGAPLIITVVLTLMGMLTNRSVKRGLRMATRQMQLCYECGYDLRGSKGSKTCPECG